MKVSTKSAKPATKAAPAKKAARKEKVYVASIGEFTPPGRDPVPMFYIREEGADENGFPTVGLSKRKVQLILNTPEALKLMREFAAA